MTSEDRGYFRGAMAAWSHILNLINAMEEKEIPRKKLYAAIIDLRPSDIQGEITNMSSESIYFDPRNSHEDEEKVARIIARALGHNDEAGMHWCRYIGAARLLLHETKIEFLPLVTSVYADPNFDPKTAHLLVLP